MSTEENEDKVWESLMEEGGGPVELDADSRMLGISLFSIRKSLIDGGFSHKEAQSMVHSAFVEIIVAGMLDAKDDED